ncbi:YoaK family protein [Peptoniphilus equinus]|uniref:YoaK family protein n=1 Tax=Peptoniphilus equinus TaxID=3016343 RepID=A0ABY7QTZ1_9FIRM|nr:YoaK family protein [Peptoniphilus equinus]WBW50244.1 YoaK family protein [Peptoniphilus equinus]
MQPSDSFTNSALLALSGGLQDAYTYNIRGHVFANAQTGNVVLMSQSLMTGDVTTALHFLLPLVSFGLGILVAEQVQNTFQTHRGIHWRQRILVLEILILASVAFMPSSYDVVANALVSFSCALQVQSFRKVHGYGYASTMCIGNLRSGTEALSMYLRTKDTEALTRTFHYYGIIAIFALGAGLGGVLSAIFAEKTILLSPMILLISFFLMHNFKR